MSVLNSGIPADVESQEKVLDSLLENHAVVSSHPGSSSFDLKAKCGRILLSTTGKYCAVCDGCNFNFDDMESFGKHLTEVHSDYCVQEGSWCQITVNEDAASNNDAIEEKESSATEVDVTCSPKSTIPKKSADFVLQNIVTSESQDQVKSQHSKICSMMSSNPTVILTNEPVYNEERNFCITCERQLDSRKAFMRHKSYHKELFRNHKKLRLSSVGEEGTSNKSVVKDMLGIGNHKTQDSAVPLVHCEAGIRTADIDDHADIAPKQLEEFASPYPPRSELLRTSCKKVQLESTTSMDRNTHQALNVATSSKAEAQHDATILEGKISEGGSRKCESEKDPEMNVSFGTLIKAFLRHDYNRKPPIKAFAIMGIDTRPFHQQQSTSTADVQVEAATGGVKESAGEGSSRQSGDEKNHDLIPNSSKSVIVGGPNNVENSVEDQTTKKFGKVTFSSKPKFDDERHFCITCNRQLDSNESFRHHKNMHKRQVHMWKLRKGWKTKKACVRIVFSQNPQFDEEKNFCTTCNRGFVSKISFESHKNSHRLKIRKKVGLIERSEVTLSCELCSEQFKSKFSLREHVVTQHGDRIPKSLEGDTKYLKCRFCHNQFEKPTERYLHEKSHANEAAPYRCSLCSKSFPRSSSRRNHELIHRENGPFYCSHCPKAFRIRAHLDRHVKLFHSLTKPFSCEYCGVSFRSKLYLTRHKFSHSRPHKCDECGMRLAKLRGLHVHKKRHANQPHYKCETCEQSFFTNNDLQQHMNIHFDVWFQCPNCEKRSSKKSDMTAHMKVHEGEDTYDSKVCDDKFTQGGGLHSHMESHSDKL